MKIFDNVNFPNDVKSLSIKELNQLSQEIREFLISEVSRTGGHLAPNLGVVELTLALHCVFSTPEDNFIWDVGHQSYVHKVLTGRKHLFSNLRKKNGLSGYPCPYESVHDTIHAGHSSTSVSLGVGLATAKKMQNDFSATVAIIGDGSFTSGMVYEALNDAAWRNIPLIIILNDNKMSISENVGGIAQHLSVLRSSKGYLQFKRRLSEFLQKMPKGSRLVQFLYRIKSLFKSFFYQTNIFENLGLPYYGPFDGHDVEHLIELFKEIKDTRSPVLVHILTEKGRGHQASLDNPSQYHGISGQDDSIAIASSTGKSWSTILGEEISHLARHNSDIVAITAAMREGTGLYKYSQEFPDRFIDVGIAEQHAVTSAAGLALGHKKPIVAIYSTFLQRSYDQLIHDICLDPLPVIFCLDRSGLVPNDGKTHQGVFDISFLRSIPNMIVMSPLNQSELRMMFDFALNEKKPVAIRYPKDREGQWNVDLPSIVKGQGCELFSGSDGVIVIFGSLLSEAEELRHELSKQNKNFALYHLRFAKPIAEEVIQYLNKFSQVVVLEEGLEHGGIGEYFKSRMGDKVYPINIGDAIPQTDTREGLIQTYFNIQKILAKLGYHGTKI